MDERKNILIVDDEPINIKILRDILKNDYAITVAKSGDPALKRAASETPPDLILLDILMPGIDGYEVCRRLKENEKTRQIPVIFISAISEVMDEAKAFSLGAVDYVAKPFNPVTVKARIKTHLDLNQAITDLRTALQKVKTLSGLLPICSTCKKIRDDTGYWKQIETYIRDHSEADFSHSICPQCAEKYYPDLEIYKNLS